MKRFFLSAAFVLLAVGLHAQSYVVDPGNCDMLHNAMRVPVSRHEVVLPEVNGYHVYKADLHVHTVYSDADVTPELRVQEAWYDGLDIMAITDHIEYRRQEGKMIAFLKGVVKDGAEAVNHNIITNPADERGIVSDLNVPVALAQKEAKKFGITIIPGVEITREPVTVGHYNALFTTDNNLVYDADPIQSMRNAKAQGAIIQHNHPGWRRKNVDHPEVERLAYEEGLIDGIESMNGGEFYPKVIDRARELGLYVSANTDIHASATETYRAAGHMRNMTFVLAKDQSLESVKEALLAGRTLAYSFGTLAGQEQLLKDFFQACVSVRVIADDGKKLTVAFTNNSSIEFMLKGGGNPFRFLPFTTFTSTVQKGKSLNWSLLNLWCGESAHPSVTYEF